MASSSFLGFGGEGDTLPKNNANQPRSRARTMSESSTSGFRTLHVKVNPWKRDNSKCYVCAAKFTLFNHRHVCRNCQEAVCHTCSRQRKVLRAYQPPKRVCDPCIDRHWMAKERAKGNATNPEKSPRKPKVQFALTLSSSQTSPRLEAPQTDPMSPCTPAAEGVFFGGFNDCAYGGGQQKVRGMSGSRRHSTEGLPASTQSSGLQSVGEEAVVQHSASPSTPSISRRTFFSENVCEVPTTVEETDDTIGANPAGRTASTFEEVHQNSPQQKTAESAKGGETSRFVAAILQELVLSSADQAERSNIDDVEVEALEVSEQPIHPGSLKLQIQDSESEVDDSTCGLPGNTTKPVREEQHQKVTNEGKHGGGVLGVNAKITPVVSKQQILCSFAWGVGCGIIVAAAGFGLAVVLFKRV